MALLVAAMWIPVGSATTETAEALVIERLTWAGVKLVAGDTTVFIDPVGRDIWDGKAPQGLVPVVATTARRYALVTHAHNDHFDVGTLQEVLGDRGYVVCHEDLASRSGFVFTALPAVDGLGDDQVSWLVRHGDIRVFHGGDTLWHGWWGMFGAQFGPIDVVFLPINGARVQQDPMPVTGIVMTPVQAIDAALLLRALRVVPIHYGLNDPPYYVETADPLGALLDEAGRRGVEVQPLRPGQRLGGGE